MVETRLDPELDVAARLLVQAGHCERLGSPFYAGLLKRAAADAEAGGPVAQVLRGHEADPPNSMLALRLLGAVRRRVLEGALPDMEWPTFRRALLDDAEAIRDLLDHPVQTNEVGRCAALLPGFLAAAADGLPLRLLEVGASAGLNLRWDRYRYAADGFGWGDPDSPLRIEFDLSGAASGAASVEVAERRGCDPRPIDPLTREGRLTLESFVWPDQERRLERLGDRGRGGRRGGRAPGLAADGAGRGDGGGAPDQLAGRRGAATGQGRLPRRPGAAARLTVSSRRRPGG